MLCNRSLLITYFVYSSVYMSIPIANWEWKTVTGFIFLASKITANGDCSHEIKRHLLFGRKAVTNLDGILKGRDITLPTKVHIFKVFPVVNYGYKS